MPTVFERIEELLADAGVEFTVTRHAAVYTSEEAAKIRGVSLSSGAKALVCKADDQFLMLVMPADRKLNSKQYRKRNGVKKLRFASREEVMEKTGLAPGSIPPFGSMFGLSTICDANLAGEPAINFNAGAHEISISMSFEAYHKVESPTLATFTSAKDAE